MLTEGSKRSAGGVPGGCGTSAAAVMRLKGRRWGHFRAAIQRIATPSKMLLLRATAPALGYVAFRCWRDKVNADIVRTRRKR